MSTVLTSKKMYIYWMHNTTWKSGVPATYKHIPFNPITESQGIKVPQRIYDLLRTSDSLYPTIELDKQLEPSTITFKTYYRDLFMMLTVFTKKTVTAAWTGTADVITGDFTDDNCVDENLAVQLHIHDNSGSNKHIDLFLDGGKITGYRLNAEAGGALMEEYDIKFAEITEGTAYYPDMDDGLDDGRFNQTGVKEVSTITAKAAASITTNKYFFIYGANGTGDKTKFHVWFNKDGAGVDPAPTGSTAIVVAITTGQAAGVVATAIGAALDAASAYFGTPVIADPLVTVTQANNGDIPDIVDVDSGLTVATTVQGKTTYDGGWSLWDGQLIDSAEKVVLASNLTLTVGSVAPVGLQVKSFSLEIDVDKVMEFVMSSMTAGVSWEDVRGPWKGSITGQLSGNDAFAQALAQVSSKTKSTFKLEIATDKYIQFTNAILKNIDGLSIPKSAEPIEVTYEYEGAALSALSCSWTGNEATDPSAYINHVDP